MSSLMMILSVNPINSVLFLIATFLSVAMIFLMLNVEFIALTLIIVYVGAIAVLFIFIVMMLNVKRLEKNNTTYLTIGSFILILFILQIILLFLQPAWSNSYYNEDQFIFTYTKYNTLDESLRLITLQKLGIILFSERPTILFLGGLILLLSMFGSIYLTNEKRGFSLKKQLIQFSKNNHILSTLHY